MPVYFLQGQQTKLIKIGQVSSLGNLPQRLTTLQTMSPDQLTLLGVNENHTDHWLHNQFSHLHSHGEWFKPGKQLLDFIEETATKEIVVNGVTLPRTIIIRQCLGLTVGGARCTRALGFGVYCGSHSNQAR